MIHRLYFALLTALLFSGCTKEAPADFFEGQYRGNGFNLCSCGVSSGYLNLSITITKTGFNTVDVAGLVSCTTLQAIAIDNRLEFTESSKCNRRNFLISRTGNDLDFSYESSFTYCYSACNVLHEGTAVRQ